MQRKFPPRKHRVGPLSEYLGNGTPTVTKITGDSQPDTGHGPRTRRTPGGIPQNNSESAEP